MAAACLLDRSTRAHKTTSKPIHLFIINVLITNFSKVYDDSKNYLRKSQTNTQEQTILAGKQKVKLILKITMCAQNWL